MMFMRVTMLMMLVGMAMIAMMVTMIVMVVMLMGMMMFVRLLALIYPMNPHADVQPSDTILFLCLQLRPNTR